MLYKTFHRGDLVTLNPFYVLYQNFSSELDNDGYLT